MAFVVTGAGGCDVASREAGPGDTAQSSDAVHVIDEAVDGDASVVNPAPPKRSLAYRVEDQSCWSHRESGDSVDVTASALDELRAIAMTSRSFAELELDALDVTAERLEAQRSVLLETLRRVAARSRAAPSLLDLDGSRSWLTFDVTADVARRVLTEATSSSLQTRLEVTLPGDPVIIVSSAIDAPGRLPWTVEMAGQSWQTYSSALPRALQAVMPTSVRDHTKLDARAYWRDGFWADDAAWQDLEEVQEVRVDLAALQARAGFRELDARFRVERPRLRSAALDHGALSVTLTAKSDEFVNLVYVLMPLEGKTPRESWADVLAAHTAVSRASERSPWLASWKAAGGQRSIAMHVVGGRLHEELYGKNLARLYGVAPAWRHARLPGDPTLELSMLRAGNVVAKIFLSETSPGALVVAANHDRRTLQAGGPHWLDREALFYTTKDPEYIFVDPQGQHERRLVPEGFPPLKELRARRASSPMRP